MTAPRTLGAIRSNPRAVLWGTVAAVGVFSLVGLVTGLIPNPLYVRMVPRTPTDYLFLILTALLAGVYTAQRLSTDVVESELEEDDAGTGSEDRWAMGGLAGGFLAVGCPICNAFLLALFSSSALMTYFDPLRPLLGAISVALLAGLIYTRHKRTCPTCAT
ncbi:hypothetical protein [Natronorubrum aibiense]|uniref:Uncharacterized protein n=1 Tax=Natronorubrum aibiense TaxID=348826 RepID=A0A5P9P502_9EURY|nr:hypothetical protein [Natronorubrum aibiense]QFU83146.1 hypothetical protein GCU68_11665 [Natronorubrum aibiense]